MDLETSQPRQRLPLEIRQQILCHQLHLLRQLSNLFLHLLPRNTREIYHALRHHKLQQLEEALLLLGQVIITHSPCSYLVSN